MYNLRTEAVRQAFPLASRDMLANMVCDTEIYEHNATGMRLVSYMGGYGRPVWSDEEMMETLGRIVSGNWY